jgi:hypothetical protein
MAFMEKARVEPQAQEGFGLASTKQKAFSLM